LSIYSFCTKVGWLTLEEAGNALTGVYFLKTGNAIFTENKLLLNAEKQISEYITGKRQHFHLPFKQEGTVFQKLVWNQLKKIPYGSTVTYKELALQLGKPSAARAVGSANNKNPLPIIIPCHRVIGQKQALRGYSGGVKLQRHLLELEKSDQAGILLFRENKKL